MLFVTIVLQNRHFDSNVKKDVWLLPCERYIIITYHFGMVGTAPNGYVTGTSQLGQVHTSPTKRDIMTSFLSALQTIWEVFDQLKLTII